MIRNIIFDMGGVLVHYDPEHFVDLLSVSAEDKALLMREVFRTVAWFRMDRGTMGEAEAAASMKANLPPRLHGGVDRLMAWWELELRPMEGMEDLVRELKELGYKLCFVSPELEAQEEKIGEYRKYIEEQGIVFDAICTKSYHIKDWM